MTSRLKHALVPAILLGLFACGMAPPSQPAPSASAALPARLSDEELWRLTQTFSEPGGTFHSENYISNENQYQTVIPELITRAKSTGVYLGVGPEQNFTYIAAIRPRMVFIFDIRRGNFLEHLLYKALMELSTDRADFVARLFSRPRPSGLGPSSSATELFDAFDAVPASQAMFTRSLTAVTDLLTKTHGFALRSEDVAGIEFIYRNAFYVDGPNLMYRRTDNISAGRRPMYGELMTMDDGAGQQRSYLAAETSFVFLKDLQAKNLVVPIVGDFGGPKALRAVGKYVRDNGGLISAFYLSNVEMYLRQDGKWPRFCASVATMPLDASSTFIRSNPMGGARGFTSTLGAMQSETRSCAAR